MRVLWGRRTSFNVQKVAWVLAETALDHDVIEVGGRHKGTETVEYRAMNPTCRVPTLVDGDLTIWESNAICRYIVDVYAGPLAQDTPGDRAHADMWMEWFQNGVYPAFIQMFYQTVRLSQADRSAVSLASAMDALDGSFAIAEAALRERPFLSGEQLGLGDIPFGACLFRYFTIDVARPNYKAIATYYDRLLASPAYCNAVMVDYSELRPTS